MLERSLDPRISTFTSAPLRNRVQVELRAPVPVVWDLLGDLTRFPEYSAGLERVDAVLDSTGACTEYVCHFKPQEEGAAGIVHREIVRWFDPHRGYASGCAEEDAFGLTNDLNLVRLDPRGKGTTVTWEEYYDARDLDAMRAEYDRALADIAERLVARFGGRVTERYVDAPRR
jgi:hypothetical protein